MTQENTRRTLTIVSQNSHTRDMGDELLAAVLSGMETKPTGSEDKKTEVQEIGDLLAEKPSNIINNARLTQAQFDQQRGLIESFQGKPGEKRQTRDIQPPQKRKLEELLSYVQKASRELTLLSLNGELSDKERKEVSELLKEIRVQRRSLESLVSRRIIAERVAKNGFDLANVPAPLIGQVLSEFSEFTTGKSVVVDESDHFTLNVGEGEKQVSFKISKSGTLLDLAKLAQEIAGKDKGALKRLERFGEELCSAALVIESYGLSPEVIEFLYNAGVHLKALAKNPQAYDSKKPERVTYERIQEASRGVNRQDQRHMFIHVLLGKGAGAVFYGKDGQEIARNPYNELHRYWAARQGKSWRTNKDYKGAKTEEEAYEMWLVKNSGKIVGVFKRFIEQGLTDDAGKAFGALQESARRTTGEAPLFVQVEKFREMFEKASIEPENGLMARAKKIGGTFDEQIQGITELFRPAKGKTLEHLPKSILEEFGGQLSTQNYEAGCAIRSAIARQVFEGKGMIVLSQIIGNHASLIAYDPLQRAVYEIDPSVPKGEGAAVRRLDNFSPIARRIVDEVDVRGIRTPKEKVVETIRFTTTQDGKVHAISGGDRILVSAFLQNAAATKEAGAQEIQVALVKEALRVFPENAAAWTLLAKLTEGTPESAKYLKRARQIDIDAKIPINLKSGVIGNFAAIAGLSPADVPPPVAGIVGAADDWIGTATDLKSLSRDKLVELISGLSESKKDAAIKSDKKYYLNLDKLIDTVGKELQRRPHTSRIALFNLSEEEIEIVQAHPVEAERMVEEQLLDLAVELRPGEAIPENVARIAQSRLDDMAKAARLVDPRIYAKDEAFQYYVREKHGIPTGTNPPGFDQLVLNEAIMFRQNLIDNIEGIETGILKASQLAEIIEGPSADQKKQAREVANRMDQQGGLNTLAFLAGIHNYQVGRLIPEFARIMEQARIANGGWLTNKQYREDVPQKVRAEQEALLMSGIGPYFNKYFNPDGTSKSPNITAADALAQARREILADSRIAHLIFIITGQASSIGIRGNATADFGSPVFWNAELRDAQRYGSLTKDARETLEKFEERGVQVWLEDTYRLHARGVNSDTGKPDPSKAASKDVIAEIDALALGTEKNHARYHTYINENGFYILAPYVDFFWENRVVRVRPMLDTARKYLADVHKRVGGAEATGMDANSYSRNFGLFMQLQAASHIGSSTLDYQDAAFNQATSFERREYVWGKIVDYFPEVPMEVLFNNPEPGHGNEKNYDPRLVEFFSGTNADYLDFGTVIAGESAKDKAERRYKNFQAKVQPILADIRNRNMNVFPPRQTNFGAEYFDEFNALGGGVANDVQAMMGNLTAFVQTRTRPHPLTNKQTTIIHDLAFDPLYEHFYRSPYTLVDMPWFFQQGINPNDPMRQEHPAPLGLRLGGNNSGRYMADAVALGESRAALIAAVNTIDPDNFVHNIETLEKVTPNIRAIKGQEYGARTEVALLSKYMQMNLPELAEFYGLENMTWWKNTEFRKIFNSPYIRALNYDTAFAFYQQMIYPHIAAWPDKVRQFEEFLKLTKKKRRKRRILQMIIAAIIVSVQETGGALSDELTKDISSGK